MNALTASDRFGSEPAAPCKERDPELPNGYRFHLGLSKREHIAAMVLQGLLSNQWSTQLGSQRAAELAIQHADTLLEELSK